MEIARGSYVRLTENIMNMILMIPLGLFLGIIQKGKHLKVNIMGAVLFCYSIKFLQLVLKKGAFELIDDPLNNLIVFFCINLLVQFSKW